MGGFIVEGTAVKGGGYSSRIIGNSVGIPGCGEKRKKGKVWRVN